MTKSDKRKYILIPVNFDEMGASVVTYGVTLARELDLDIRLLHVLTMAGIPAPVEAHAGSVSYNYEPGDLMDERRTQAMEKLKAMSNRVRNETGLDCRFTCKFGFVDIQVLKQSDKDRVAMVVMGAPRHDTVLDQLLGSRSLKIVNHGNTPVLLVPNLTSYLPLKKIAVGASYENWDNARIQWITDLAAKLKAALHFVRVTNEKTTEESMRLKGYRNQVMESMPDNIDHQFKVVQSSSIGHGIRDYAYVNHVDLIALQRSEKSGWEHFFSENVPKDMVLGTSLPVLVF
jgi:nucleotide-binding universal stress UspA family protein